MRPKITLRTKRSVHAVIAMIMLAVPASAFALTGAVTNTKAAVNSHPVHARVTPRRATLNHLVTVTGVAPAPAAGHYAILESAASRRAGWRYLADTQIASSGRYSVTTRLRHSGYLRVIDAATPSSSGLVSSGWSASPAGTTTSKPIPVTVAAKFELARHSLDSLGGGPVALHGALYPARAGRVVRVQGRAGHGWQTLARTRTGRKGAFQARLTGATGLGRSLRVMFAGDRGNARSVASAGSLTVFTASVASWYNDAGNTACGFHAGLGVANLSLPCGTKVRFRYGGRSVTATVDDRGPYVGGREWDLNQNTAAALGFAGVGTVWSSQ